MNKRLLTLLVLCTAVLASNTSFAQTGGPDTFGYSYAPATFDWVPLASEAGATAHNTGDDGVAVVTLPWTFSWYGVDYTEISIGTNGGVSFGAGQAVSYTNACLPSSPLTVGAPDLMVFWDDMNQGSGGNVYSWDDVMGGRFIVSWEGVPRFFAIGAGSFQVHLYPGGAVEFHWEDTDFGDPSFDNGASATVGIQDKAGGTQGLGNWLEWSCNTPSIVDGTAASFSSCTDADGDGAGDPACGGLDCDDNDPTVYPGALELCDGLDTDCDPLTSETVDADGDGETVCAGDCDDTDAANSSLLPEVCDGADNDCNGTADADVGGEVDGDGDGVLSCEDCDDTDSAVFPGAIEICNGGIDDDCDAATDETTSDTDSDGWTACGPDGIAGTADDDCNDGEFTVNPGATELCDGLDNDCDELMLGGGSQVVASLTTTMAGGNGSSGNVFDLVAINDLSITSFDINTSGSVAGTVDVYTMTGTSIGNHQTASLWTLHETVAVIGSGSGVATPVPLVTPIDLVAGDTYGIYIHSSLGIQYTNGTSLPVPSPSVLFASDANLEFYEGYGMGAPAFSSAGFYPRVWNGTIHYGDGVNLEGDGDGDGYVECVWIGSDPGIIGGDDCNDGASTVYPGAPELCDGEDTDCDPSTDENVDVDGDLDTLCDGDCDETDPTIGPSQTEIGCDGIDNDCDAATIDSGDGDGDGVDVCAGDCDDLDPLAFPGAPEICGDGIDQDCDTFDTVVDVDGDGFSDSSCGGLDCDDSAAAVFPGATEVLCDGTDNDCDPLTLNENDVDADGVTDCGADGVLGTADDDCDDSDGDVFPGNLEICNGGIDDDCDAATDETADFDGDGVSACGPDGVADTADDDCNDGEATVYPGATELCDGLDNDCDELMLGGGSQVVSSLTTTMAGGNGSSGNVFDLVAINDLSITSFDINATAAVAGTVDVYTMTGTSVGSQQTAALWTLHETVPVTGMGLGVATSVPLGTPIDLVAGGTYGIYIHSSLGIQYTNGTTLGALFASDANLEFYEGYGMGAPAFGSNFSPRVWNGTIHYGDGVNLEGDSDGDGYVECVWLGSDPAILGGDDCNDGASTVYPGAPELCDGEDTDCDPSTDENVDVDGDLDTICDGDCDETDPTIGPSQTEIGCDGIDNDCDPVSLDDGDVDGDGVEICLGDCDDSDPLSYPGAPEICGDGIDQDCDLSDYIVDADGDGYSDSACGGDDCDDVDSAISPAAAEVLCDGVDNDCDPLTLNENDVDTDGVTDCGPDGVFGTADDDCDDNDATVFPGNPEACDAADNDCDGLPLPDEVDLDGDGEMVCAGDCDDADPANFAAGTEVCDGADNDCDGLSNFDPAMEMDFDGDGWLSCEDCADNAAESFPGNIEICDGLDNDCNGLADYVGEPLGDDDDDDSAGDDDDDSAGDDDDSAGDDDDSSGDDDDSASGDDDDSAAARGAEGDTDELDLDGDGFLDCDDDCDDDDSTLNPLAEEICDGIDQDCDGVVPADESDDDGDGMRICEGDCDDSDPATYDGAPEDCDGFDNDCDDTIDDEELDTDGDGYSPCEGDCDDTTADSNPDAEEICDGLDNDCDEALPTEESDADGDGFLLCADDCDDADDTISPDSGEDSAGACDDELDNDCDGLIDLDDEGCDDFIPDGPVDSSDCDCSVVSGGGSAGLGLLLLGLLGLVRRRRSGLLG